MSLAPLALLLAACSTPAPPEERVVVVAVPTEITVPHPLLAVGTWDSEAAAALFVPGLDARFDDRLVHEPGAYATWVHGDDGRTLTATLRDGLTWSDGAPVTADDVRLTYALARDPGVASPRATYTRWLVEGSPEALSPREVRFTFTHAYDPVTQRLHAALPPLPSHRLRDLAPAAVRSAPEVRRPTVIDGPFRIETFEPGERLVLAANPAWRGPDGRPPGLDRLVLRVLPEPSTRLLAYEAGEVDVVDGLSVRDADRLARAVPGSRVVSKGLRLGEHLVWNTRDPRFADVATRAALAHALDVEAFLGRAFADAEGVVHARRAVGTITPLLADVVPDVVPVPYDPATARTLLAAAGWSDPDGDGVLDRDGQRLAFELLYAAANPRRHEAAQWIRARLGEVGAAVTLAPRDSTAVFDAMRRRAHAAALAGWSSALAVDPSPLWRADTPERPNPSNVSGWGDPALDAAIDAALRARDPADAAARWREVQRTIFAAQPFAFLWWHDDRVVVRARVAGAQPGVLGVLDDVGSWSVAP